MGGSLRRSLQPERAGWGGREPASHPRPLSPKGERAASSADLLFRSVPMGLPPAKLDENQGWRRRAVVWHVCAPFERAHTSRQRTAGRMRHPDFSTLRLFRSARFHRPAEEPQTLKSRYALPAARLPRLSGRFRRRAGRRGARRGRLGSWTRPPRPPRRLCRSRFLLEQGFLFLL